MPCEIVNAPGLGKVIVCSRGGRKAAPRCACGKPSGFQCDHPTGKGRTCDRYLCRACRVHDGGDRDLCPEHAADPANADPGPLFRQPVSR